MHGINKRQFRVLRMVGSFLSGISLGHGLNEGEIFWLLILPLIFSSLIIFYAFGRKERYKEENLNIGKLILEIVFIIVLGLISFFILTEII